MAVVPLSPKKSYSPLLLVLAAMAVGTMAVAAGAGVLSGGEVVAAPQGAQPTASIPIPLLPGTVVEGERVRPNDVLDVANADWKHAFEQHPAIAPCVWMLAQVIAPDQAWWAARGQSPVLKEQKNDSIMFVWNADPATKLGIPACNIVGSAIAREHGLIETDDLTKGFRLLAIVGFRPDGTSFPVSMYAVPASPTYMFQLQLKSHGFYTCLYGCPAWAFTDWYK